MTDKKVKNVMKFGTYDTSMINRSNRILIVFHVMIYIGAVSIICLRYLLRMLRTLLVVFFFPNSLIIHKENTMELTFNEYLEMLINACLISSSKIIILLLEVMSSI